MKEQESEIERGRDPEATVIRPLFDEDATEVARPVIPLDDRALTEGVSAYVETGTAPPVYTRAWKLRNQWTAILVLAALFAGTIVGITGLYLYQRSRTSAETAGQTAATQQAPAASEATQTATAPQPITPDDTAAVPETAPPPAAVEAPATAETEVAAGAEPEKSTVKVSDGEGASRETPRASARREQPEEEEPAAAPVRRGRKGDDETDEPRQTRPRVYDTQEPAPSGSAAERRAAREEDRLRRMRRERRRGRGEAYMVDSIRGIFEGGRQSPPR